ncbi:MAG: sialate O-acetylesterase [Mariniblastus sp.]|jgi:sialate O-acetylesterase
MKRLPLSLLFLFCLCPFFNQDASDVSADELRAANIFTDNMVLQRNEPFLIWGTANAGEKVTVTIQNQTVYSISSDEGKWVTLFSPVSLGEPFEVKVSGDSKELNFKNVVAGEVWICSGQSNMEWDVKRCGNAKEEIASANWPMIRHVRVDHVTSTTKREDVTNTGWQVCSPETVGDFSAVGYYFGRELHKKLDVPIGLLHTSWGGTIIETWISAESLAGHPDFRETVAQIVGSGSDDATKEQNEKKLQAWMQAQAAALTDKTDQWQAADLDDGNWKSIKVPGNWENQGYASLDGIAWYRRSFEVPADAVGKQHTLSIAKIDDVDETFVNGKQIGGLTDWTALRKYSIPAGVLKPGKNTIAIRVTDSAGGGGIHGEAKNVFLQAEGGSPVSLAGDWKFKPTTKSSQLKPQPRTAFNGPNHPTLLHNAMVNPFLRYNARGVIWYQGESNAGRAYQYRSLMPLLVQDWRRKWNKDLPFYWVQLANFRAAATEPGDSEWAELREAQSMALRVPRTGQAVIIDIGEARNIHPKNKQDVGIRLALNALAKDYGKSVEFSGPVYRSMSKRGNQVRLEFSHANGLMAKGGELKRFEIAGADKKFVWANATIQGNSVVVSSDSVSEPAAVRYAWSDNPEGCNLYNGSGLPASPFRTDDWKGVTQN